MIKQSEEFLNKNIDLFTKKDVLKLADLIKYHSNLYYNKENPIISDKQYDDLFRKLEILEKKYDIKNKQSNKIGAEVLESTFKKVKHSRPMISLDNTYNEEELNDFNERVFKNIDDENIKKLEYTLEFKFDGLGVELIYKNGKLIQAITRGNGIEGEDVTVNVMQIANIPKQINYKDYLEVRGEVVMPISSFDNLNKKAKQEGNKVFSNPRNAASGSLRMKDASVTKTRKLKFFAYDLANWESFILSTRYLPSGILSFSLSGEKETESNYFEVIKNLEKLGFEISSYFEVCNGIGEVIDKIDNFGDLKKELDFEIDGLVIKVNNINLWEQIGWTEHHPKYAISYKFPAEIFTTKILSIDHQVGRTGTITPVANLEPINMGGAVIRRATLHNYEEVENLDVRIGDNVFIKRAGEVIPKIISVVKTGNRDNLEKIEIPKYCPSCESEVLKDEGKVRYYCPNNFDCPAKNSEKLAFAVGKQGFNIDGLGERQVEIFLELGIIHNIVDIFKIEEKKEEILKLEGFQEKSVQNLIIGLEKAKNIEIATLLTALGISGVGKKTAKTIAKLLQSKNDLINFRYLFKDLEKLADIGPEIANNIIEYFNNDSHIRILEELSEILNIKYYEDKSINSDSIFAGKKVCITGSFELDGKKIARDDLVKNLEDAGGEFMSSVSKNLDYLLAGEKAGSKLEKANELGIEIINLTYFLKSL